MKKDERNHSFLYVQVGKHQLSLLVLVPWTMTSKTLYPEQHFFCGANQKLSLKHCCLQVLNTGHTTILVVAFLPAQTILQIVNGVTMWKANLKKDLVNFSSGESTSTPGNHKCSTALSLMICTFFSSSLCMKEASIPHVS